MRMFAASRARRVRKLIAASAALLIFLPSASASSISINAQPRERLVDGGLLRLAITKVPIQYNPYHFDGDLVDVESMMGLVLPRMTFTNAKANK